MGSASILSSLGIIEIVGWYQALAPVALVALGLYLILRGHKRKTKYSSTKLR